MALLELFSSKFALDIFGYDASIHLCNQSIESIQQIHVLIIHPISSYSIDHPFIDPFSWVTGRLSSVFSRNHLGLWEQEDQLHFQFKAESPLGALVGLWEFQRKSVKICMVSLRKSNVVEWMLYIWPYSTYNVESYIETTLFDIWYCAAVTAYLYILYLAVLDFQIALVSNELTYYLNILQHWCQIKDCTIALPYSENAMIVRYMLAVQHRLLRRNFYDHWLEHDFHQVVWVDTPKSWEMRGCWKHGVFDRLKLEAFNVASTTYLNLFFFERGQFISTGIVCIHIHRYWIMNHEMSMYTCIYIYTIYWDAPPPSKSGKWRLTGIPY